MPVVLTLYLLESQLPSTKSHIYFHLWHEACTSGKPAAYPFLWSHLVKVETTCRQQIRQSKGLDHFPETWCKCHIGQQCSEQLQVVFESENVLSLLNIFYPVTTCAIFFVFSNYFSVHFKTFCSNALPEHTTVHMSTSPSLSRFYVFILLQFVTLWTRNMLLGGREG